ncbi:MAG: hypothetical protein HQM09_15910 [Candidatus Riflebacteria bacterium]|nr:hypothetical protein [Candidatus Riflebacteria bacterium]
MNTLTQTHVKSISRLLILSMLLSCWLAIPMPAKAGVLKTAGQYLKTAVVTGGALAAGYMGGVLGIAVGGGPIGMAAGAVGGYVVGKKIMGWTTASFANAATVAGAVGGGLLVMGMGAPVLAVGVIGGALIGRSVAALIKKITGKSSPMVSVKAVPQSKVDDAKSQDFINHLLPASKAPVAAPVAATPTPAPVAVAPAAADIGQDSYNRYLSSYKAYIEASQNGDAAAAQKCFSEYQKNLAAYQASKK